MSKIAYITGGGRGMGRAICLAVANNYQVVASDININNAKETIELVKEIGGEGFAVHCDVTSLESVERSVKEVQQKYGSIDLLVNNAGWDKIEPFLQSEPDTWRKVIDINLMGQVHTCKMILPLMIENGKGKVVNIASDSGRVGSSGEGVYSAAKGGVIAFTKTIAREMARYQINVNCIAPGPADTPLFQEIGSYNKGIAAALEKAIPFRKLAQPEDIAGAVAFFASKEADYITGQTLSVNGGLTMC
ncbi:SDR family oxidoreductase [Cytobacillus sp. FSL W7-1323]|uniref:2-hydroxycyclohexanecarboxyl-CoA dehydrogenase n=1 Tax=Cytobacillus kochii TaxID=859143 RepID=A0A248TNU2_9BACI|nr:MULTISPECIES: SDR family oxidoreductase [Cytobacillus]ASV69898.1 2-hydroxycyclohexanecarboxyl-CoA dehydrogenase [Cytobacillus kochii]MDQ0184695.1 2-hydroxycyclohexanecarboxyl-CoA dehydrogenase [Cytobacillus kochii]MEA1852088.1 SDR family oxidoreductase [Cytobacillus sp. OWB-43]MED1606617.1 SDR family oxidoreductase [Cytobacillus kochii]